MAIAAAVAPKYEFFKTSSDDKSLSDVISRARLAIDTADFNKRKAEGRLPIFYYLDEYKMIHNEDRKETLFLPKILLMETVESYQRTMILLESMKAMALR